MSNYEWHYFYKWFWVILPFYVGHFALSKIIEWNFVWVSMMTIIFAKYNTSIVAVKKKHPQDTKSYSSLNSLIVLLPLDEEMGGSSLLWGCSSVSDGLADHSVVSRSLFGDVHCLIYAIFFHLLDCLSLPPHDLEYRIHILPHGKFKYNFKCYMYSCCIIFWLLYNFV